MWNLGLTQTLSFTLYIQASRCWLSGWVVTVVPSALINAHPLLHPAGSLINAWGVYNGVYGIIHLTRTANTLILIHDAFQRQHRWYAMKQQKASLTSCTTTDVLTKVKHTDVMELWQFWQWNLPQRSNCEGMMSDVEKRCTLSASFVDHEDLLGI